MGALFWSLPAEEAWVCLYPRRNSQQIMQISRLPAPPDPDFQSGLSSALVGGQCDTRRREKQQFTRQPDSHSHSEIPIPNTSSKVWLQLLFLRQSELLFGTQKPRQTAVQTVFTVLAAKFILFQAICHRFASVAKKDDSAGRIIYLGGQRGFYLFSCDFMSYFSGCPYLTSCGKLFPDCKWFRGWDLAQASVWTIFFTNFPLNILYSV